MPKISVITAIYNAAPFLEESILSILGQSFQDFELILVDDASTDGSANILSKYSLDPRITILTNKDNTGCAGSRNRAFLAAKADLIAIHDADDISLPNRLEKQITHLEETKSDIVGSYAHKINVNGEMIGLMRYPPPNTQLCIRAIQRWILNPVIDPSSIYKREVLTENNLYSTDKVLSIAADFDLWCNALIKGRQISNIQKPLIKYRIHDNSNTVKKKIDMDAATDNIWFRFMLRCFN